MKQKIISLLFVLISATGIGQNVTDGNAAEWKLPLKNYDSQAHLQYTASNNDSMLFVCVRVPDVRFQIKLANAGMTLYIDTTGKKKQTIAVNFPIKPKNPEPVPMGRPRGLEGGANNAKKMIEPALKQFNTKGFITGNGTYALKNIEGIMAVGAYDSIDILTLEYQIPLKTFYHKLTGADKDKKISLILVVNSLPMPQMGDGPPGDGPPRGGPPSGEDMPNPQDMEQMFQSSTTVFKYTFEVN